MEHQAANNQLMQKMNRLKVLRYVRRNPECSRPVIARETGLSLSSITNITTYLMDIGILYECGMEQVGRVGRKSALLRMRETRNDLICAFVSGSQTNLYVTDLLGVAKEKYTVSTEGCSGEESLQRMTAELKRILSLRGRERFLAIGVAVSGLILEDSRFVMSSELKWRSLDLKHTLEQETGLPVFVDNNSQLRAVWYYRSAGFSQENMVYVDLEGGIGAVQLADGSICRNTLGEIGHTTVKKDGEPCFCGNRGCLEAMCSVKRLFSLYESAQGSRPTSLTDLQRLYEDGESAAVFAVESCGTYLGIGLANLVNLLNPQMLAIHTGSFTQCPSVLTVAERELRRRSFPALTENLLVHHTTQTEDTMLSGMAQILCDRVFDIAFPNNIVE